jgi:hypothetical protein
MDHEQTLSSTKVAVLGGFLLLLGLLAVAAFLLLTASPAGAQSDEAATGSEPASSDSGQAQEPAPAESDRADAPPEGGGQGIVETESTPSGSTEVRISAPAPVDAIVEPVLPPVELVVPLSLPPVVPELPPAPVSVQVAPARARPTPIDTAPDVNVPPPVPGLPGPSVGAETPAAPVTRPWSASPSRSTTEFRSGSSPLEGGTRAPPFGPAVAAPGSSVSSSSTARDFGQSLLLFGVIAAGIVFALTRGRRLLAEALGWLPARWCPLMERPG